MKSETLEFIKKYVDKDTLYLISNSSEDIEKDFYKLSDAQRVDEISKKYKNPKFELFCALDNYEKDRCEKNMRKIFNCAINQDEFVTALYWFNKLNQNKKPTLAHKLELKYLTFMADFQKKQDKNALEYSSTTQFTSTQPTYVKLADRRYLDETVNLKKALSQKYQEKLDSIEKSILLPEMKKSDSSGCFSLLLSLIIFISGGVLLFKTTVPVWKWFEEFFFPDTFLLYALYWLPPVLYVVLVIVLTIVLSLWVGGSGIQKDENKVQKKLLPILKECEYSLDGSDSVNFLAQMNKELPSEFHNYDSRLALAIICSVYGENDIKKLCALLNDTSSWLTKFYAPDNTQKDEPFRRYIDSLLDKTPSEADIFSAYALCRKHIKNPQIPENYNFILGFWSVDYKSDKNAKIMFSYEEDFLLKEIENAKLTDNTWHMGQCYYNLYMLYTSNYVFSNSACEKKAYQYGTVGINYSEELKYYVLYTYAGKSIYDSYNPHYSLGFNRSDVIKYASELSEKNDPRGEDLRKRLDKIDEYARNRAREDQDEEARAYWEEYARNLKEKEEARERARDQLNKRADEFERGLNMHLTGNYETEEERALKGETSELDYIRHKNLRDDIINKKLDEQ